MSQKKKLLDAARNNPNDVSFADLCRLVEWMGYSMVRQRGAHRHYRRKNYPGITLQPVSGKAKAYQVGQVLEILDTYQINI